MEDFYALIFAGGIGLLITFLFLIYGLEPPCEHRAFFVSPICVPINEQKCKVLYDERFYIRGDNFKPSFDANAFDMNWAVVDENGIPYFVFEYE